jgi:hypothetical protein
MLQNGQPVYGRVFQVDPHFGPFVGVYDSLGMPQNDLDAIIQRPLVVKIFPIHHENLEKRAWLVIGNRPLTAADDKLPRGHVQIAGANEQLEAANYYYGLGPATFYNIDTYIIKKQS